MRLSKSWVVASKDFKTFKKKKGIIFTLIGFVILVSVVLPLIIGYAASKPVKASDLASGLPLVISSFALWFVIGAGILPTGIASYSIIGEKVQKSLEPLLATPVTDTEILIGKALAAFIPTMIALYIGSIIFMSLIDIFTFHLFGYLFYPNWNMALMLLVIAPIYCLLSVAANILISSKVNDVRTAQQLGGAIVTLPFFAIYILSLTTILKLTTTSLLIISGAILVIGIIVFFVAKSTFQREEILTKWK